MSWDIFSKSGIQYLLTKLKTIMMDKRDFVELTKAQYDALPDTKLTDGKYYFLTDINALTGNIDDSVTTNTDTWSSSKINGELGDKADIETLKEYEVVESDNYLPNKAENKVDSRGITFSVNSKDKSVIANGTATANLYFRIASYFTVPKTGTYKLLGTPPDATGRRELYVFPESTGSAVMADLDGTGATGELTAGVLYGASIYIANGVTLSNKVYKPMLTTNLDATYDDYVKYSLALKDQLKEYEVTPSENLLPTTAATQAISGNNFVVRDDKTVLVSVPANPTTTNFYLLGNTSVLKMTLPAGKYKLIGCPSGGSGSTYYIQGFGNKDYTTGSGIVDFGNGVEFTLTQENELYFFISIRNTFTSGGTLLFKPMVTTNLAATYDDYEPYYLPVKDAMWTKEQQKLNGAYNLCSNEKLSTKIVGSTLTVTFNPTGYPKGSVRLQGYVSTGQWVSVNYRTMKLKQNQKYKLCGVIGGSSSTYRLRYYDDAGGNATVYDDDDSTNIREFICCNPDTAQVDIYVNTGATSSNPIDTVIYPMVTTDLTATYRDYVPYAMTNSELTEVKTYRYQTANAGANVTFLECNVLKNGRIVYITGSWTGDNTNTEPLLVLPTELRPSDYVRGTGSVYVPSHPTITAQFGVYNLASDGKITQSTDTRKGTMGSFVFVYNL